jgi:hypothetical protein
MDSPGLSIYGRGRVPDIWCRFFKIDLVPDWIERSLLGIDRNRRLGGRHKGFRDHNWSDSRLALGFQCAGCGYALADLGYLSFCATSFDGISSGTTFRKLDRLPAVVRGRPILGQCVPGKPRAHHSGPFHMDLVLALRVQERDECVAAGRSFLGSISGYRLAMAGAKLSGIP